MVPLHFPKWCLFWQKPLCDLIKKTFWSVRTINGAPRALFMVPVVFWVHSQLYNQSPMPFMVNNLLGPIRCRNFLHLVLRAFRSLWLTCNSHNTSNLQLACNSPCNSDNWYHTSSFSLLVSCRELHTIIHHLLVSFSGCRQLTTIIHQVLGSHGSCRELQRCCV